MAPPTIYTGTFIHSTESTPPRLEYLHDTAIYVSNAEITHITSALPSPPIFPGYENAPVVASPANSFFFPGFVDSHIHASQYANAGLFGKTTLLEWLNTYTFPMEASLSDLQKAKRVYEAVIARTLRNGTTAAAYYATRDVDSTTQLAKCVKAAGQRALVGRCAMDIKETCPEWYVDESTASSIEATRQSVAAIKAIDPAGDYVRPCITPRFAPSCSKPLLTGLGKLAAEEGCHVQTHLAENKSECSLVSELFPENHAAAAAGDLTGYTAVYTSSALLSRKTILAHAIHLSPAEYDAIKRSKAGISHCPVSNSSLGSGICKVREFLKRDIEVGLGTDMSGGYSASVLEVARQAVVVSRLLAEREGDDSLKISVEEALYMATRGGARICGLAGIAGGFEVGLEWDAVLVSLGEGKERGPVDLFGTESWEEKVQKWVFNGDDRNNRKVWVKGEEVYSS